MKVLYLGDLPKKQDFFFTGDWHRGNKLSDTKALLKDLNRAKEREARILLDGDIFDNIFPRDPRFMPHLLDDRYHGRDDAVDLVIEDTVELLKPYAHLIDVVGDGNHEWQLAKRFSTNMSARLVRRLNAECGTNVRYGGYSYYAVYNMKVGKKRGKYLNIFVHHGRGTAAPVTKGMIDIARFRDAGWIYDILVFGHKHNSFVNKNTFISPNVGKGRDGFLDVSETREVQTGTYQQSLVASPEGSTQMANWSETICIPPTNLGGNFATVEVKSHRRTNDDVSDDKVYRDTKFHTTIEV